MEHSCKQGIKGISTAIALLPRPGATATGHAPLPAQVHGRGSRRPVVPEPNAVQVTGIQVTVAVRTVRRCRRLERPKERRVDDGGVNSRQNCDRAKPNPTSMQHHAHDPRRTAEYRAGPIISLVGTRLTGVTERTSTAFAKRASPATWIVSVCGHRSNGRRGVDRVAVGGGHVGSRGDFSRTFHTVGTRAFIEGSCEKSPGRTSRGGL